MPLHIFEPRYRQMVADAAADHQCIGMALLKEGWEDDYLGRPPIFPTACAGRLVSIEPLPDGRYNILLQGLERVEVEEEFHDRPYRRARVSVRPTALPLSETTKRELLHWVQAYAAARKEPVSWQQLADASVQDENLVNGLGTYLDWTPLEKQLLLEADGLEQRARRLIDLLRFAVQADHRPSGWN